MAVFLKKVNMTETIPKSNKSGLLDNVGNNQLYTLLSFNINGWPSNGRRANG